MEQIIALVIFALIAIGGSLLRKYLEKQQREQEAAKRHTGQQAERRQGQRQDGKQTSGPPRTFYGRPGEPRPPQTAEQPTTARQRQPAQPQRRRQPVAAAPRSPQTGPQAGRSVQRHRPQQAQPRRGQPPQAADAQAEAAQRAILQQVRTSATRREVAGASERLSRLDQAGSGTSTSATDGVGGQRGAGRVDYIGTMLQGRNVARAIVLSEILGPPKALR